MIVSSEIRWGALHRRWWSWKLRRGEGPGSYAAVDGPGSYAGGGGLANLGWGVRILHAQVDRGSEQIPFPPTPTKFRQQVVA